MMKDFVYETAVLMCFMLYQILRRPKIGAGYRVIDMITEPYRLIRRCEVTAILVLYGLPRYPSVPFYVHYPQCLEISSIGFNTRILYL